MPPTMFKSIHINIISCVYPHFSWRNLKSCQTSKVSCKVPINGLASGKTYMVLPWSYPFCTIYMGVTRCHLWDPRNPRRRFVANAQIGAVPDRGLCHGMALHHTFSRRQGLVEGLQKKKKTKGQAGRNEKKVRFWKDTLNYMWIIWIMSSAHISYIILYVYNCIYVCVVERILNMYQIISVDM